MAEPGTRPPALRRGDTVAVLAPSGPVDQSRLAAGVRALEDVGLKPDVLDSARATTDHLDAGYLAGDDDVRAADVTAALTDPAYAAVFCARGGYGAQRVLDRVDWSAVDRDARRTLVGFSDVTALLEAVLARLGWVSVFGPMVSSEAFAPGGYSFDTLMGMLLRPEDATTMRFPVGRALVPGHAEGVTLGGTVSLLASSVGTATSVPAQGGIVLFEEVDEEPYRLDRLLTQLLRSGYLDGVAGIVAGSFANCGDRAVLERVLLDRLGRLGVPILTGADIGHGVPQQAFPIGVRACLDSVAGTLTLEHPALA